MADGYYQADENGNWFWNNGTNVLIPVDGTPAMGAGAPVTPADPLSGLQTPNDGSSYVDPNAPVDPNAEQQAQEGDTRIDPSTGQEQVFTNGEWVTTPSDGSTQVVNGETQIYNSGMGGWTRYVNGQPELVQSPTTTQPTATQPAVIDPNGQTPNDGNWYDSIVGAAGGGTPTTTQPTVTNPAMGQQVPVANVAPSAGGNPVATQPAPTAPNTANSALQGFDWSSLIAPAVGVGGALLMNDANRSATNTAADATLQAANVASQSQTDALNYLKSINMVPQGFKEEAMKVQAGVYGLPGGTGNQQDLIDRAINSPLYKKMMGGKDAGEQAILRNAAATGGLRSGNVQENLYDYNVQLENNAMLAAYQDQLNGLAGFAGTPTNETNIANTMQNIGATNAAGITGAANVQQQGSQQNINNMGNLINNLPQYTNLANQALGGLNSLSKFNYSDRRLKKNLKVIGEIGGFKWYSWTWNKVAEKMGLKGKSQGVIADDIYKDRPDCIGIKNLFMIVDYGKLFGMTEMEGC